MKRKSIFWILVLFIFMTGCVQEETEEPTIYVVEETEEPSVYVIEETKEQEEKKTGNETRTVSEEPEFDGRTLKVTATETRFTPSEFNVEYGEKVRIIVTSEEEHNFYAPTLKINKEIKIGETEIFIPTDRRGTHMFWCNLSHNGPEHRKMNARIRVQ